jgi:LCP family protein required for cell wall assembly
MKTWLVAALAAAGVFALACILVIGRNPLQQAVVLGSADRAFHSHRLNVLLLGYQDDEGNSDSLILAHLDIDRRIATLVSIPRDTWVEIPGHGYQKINSAIGFGGPALSAKIVSALVGAPIDATIAVQPEGAKALVDAMGGMNVAVDRDMDYDDNAGNLHIHLKAGEQYLTGGQVLEFVRFRHDAESDWGRVRRQQIVLKALIDQLGAPQNWVKLPQILKLARSDVKTNLGDAQVAALLQIYRGVPSDNVRTFTLPARAAYVGDASVVIVDARWARFLGRLLFSKSDPPQNPVLVANATGITAWNKKLVAALRGGGWNVPTFIDEPVRDATAVAGSDDAAAFLAKTLGVPRTAAKGTTLVIGRDYAPVQD